MKEHTYNITLEWTGNTGQNTRTYTGYYRSHIISMHGKPVIECSSDPAFRGDPGKHNPEELFVASLSSCHMLWFLHLCADNKIEVITYADHALGTMTEDEEGGRFTEVILHPKVVITNPEKVSLANSLHHMANKKCFISNSCNFPVKHEPKTIAGNQVK